MSHLVGNPSCWFSTLRLDDNLSLLWASFYAYFLFSGACGDFDGHAGNDPTDTTDPINFATNWSSCYGYGYR